MLSAYYGTRAYLVLVIMATAQNMHMQVRKSFRYSLYAVERSIVTHWQSRNVKLTIIIAWPQPGEHLCATIRSKT